jgi:hypothetical protein
MRNRRVAFIPVCLSLAEILLALAGCSASVGKSVGSENMPGELESRVMEAENRWVLRHAEISAVVSVPAGEAMSAGTYVANITFPGGAQVINAGRDGRLSGAWLTDIGSDLNLDLLIWMTSAGSGSYGMLKLYTRRGNRFMETPLADLSEEQSEGYMGHDVFDVVDGELLRSFALYLPGDPNAGPTGGKAWFKYSFKDDMWIALE